MTGIDVMRENAALGDAIFGEVVKELRKGFTGRQIKTELDLANLIKLEIESTGGVEAFPTIVTSGKRAGNDIHMKPTKSKLEGFVIIDFGIKRNGFCSDMTRTIYVGKPTESEMQVYNILLRAQNASIKYIRAGFPASVGDAFVRGILAENSYKGKPLSQYFIHTLGHGISRKVHESPKLFFKSKEILKEGKVVTIEPGIYIKNTLGIRIEDMYLITAEKPEALTKSPKKLLVFS